MKKSEPSLSLSRGRTRRLVILIFVLVFAGWVVRPVCRADLALMGTGAAPVGAQSEPVTRESILDAGIEEQSQDDEYTEMWLDRVQQGLHGLVWRSARSVDGWMGPPLEDEVYQQASGSISAAALWDEFEGFDARVRFNVDVPLPRINERLHLFIGRYDPEEYVTERRDTLGVIPYGGRDMGEMDETMAGLIYRRLSSDGSSFSGSVGGSIRSGNPDPYVKASYQFRRPVLTDTLLTFRGTVFYRVSEGFGSTTRIDVEHGLNPLWHLRWTTSGTISEQSKGVRGFSTVTATRSLPGRRALVVRAGIHGETAAEVPLRNYGVKVAYRTSVIRPWFVVELCTSLMWPRYRLEHTRAASLGFGIGCEMYFGNKAFSSRPVTF